MGRNGEQWLRMRHWYCPWRCFSEGPGARRAILAFIWLLIRISSENRIASPWAHPGFTWEHDYAFYASSIKVGTRHILPLVNAFELVPAVYAMHIAGLTPRDWGHGGGLLTISPFGNSNSADCLSSHSHLKHSTLDWPRH